MAASLMLRLVDLHRRQLAGVVEVRGVGRMRRLYGESRRELEEKLAALVRAGRGRTFQAQHLRMVLVQVADVARSFQGQLEDHLRSTGRMAANLAPRHLVDMVGKMESSFGRMTPVVQAAQAAVVRGVFPRVAPSLLTQYRSSVRTWGPGTIRSIQGQLARSIVQGEGVDEAVGRVVRSGGLWDGERWRAERVVRTELAYSYGVTKQASMEQLAPAVPRMMKRLVATLDDRTGEDSRELNGQTVPVGQPFVWEVKDARGKKTGRVVRYMQPPNRPNDREVVVPWVEGWGGMTRPSPA